MTMAPDIEKELALVAQLGDVGLDFGEQGRLRAQPEPAGAETLPDEEPGNSENQRNGKDHRPGD